MPSSQIAGCFAILFLIIIPPYAQAQKSMDLLQRLEKSKMAYIVQQREDAAPALVLPDALPETLCRQKVDGKMKNFYVSYGEKINEFQTAERLFAEGGYAKAREGYMALAEARPEDAHLMARIGACYRNEGNAAAAEEWLRKAIATNTIAFAARRELALLLADDKKTRKEALDHAILASLLSRNDSLSEEVLVRVAKANKSKYKGWDFVPMAEVSTNGQDSVLIDLFDLRWLGYGLSRAAYQYEPSYQDELRATLKEGLMVTPYRDALLMLYEDTHKDTKKTDASLFGTLRRTVDLDLLEEFMLYEIIIPMDPYAVFGLNDEVTERVVMYVKKAKLGLKK